MPTNLQALVRLKTIDRCLKDKSRKYNLEDLIEAVNDNLIEYLPSSKGISERTIYGDLSFLKNDQYGFNAPIHRTNELGYHYTSENFSIFNPDIHRSDLEQIKDVIISLRQISSKELFDGLNNALIALEEVLNLNVPSNEQSTIFYEASLNEEGQKWITKIHEAIREKKTINLGYEPFDKPALNHYFCPYFLKEYNNRWFVFGYEIQPPGNEGYEGIAQFGLDRIKSFNESLLPFYHMESFQYNDLVDNIIGVSIRDTQIENIKFKVFGTRRHYVRTKPIHRNQKTIDFNDEYGLFEIAVIPNPEMYSKFLSFGKDLKILSPLGIVSEMKSIIVGMQNNYLNRL